jgi:hypothetical protein
MSGAPRLGVYPKDAAQAALERTGRNRLAGWHRQGREYFSNLDYAELPKVLVLGVLVGGLFAFIV